MNAIEKLGWKVNYNDSPDALPIDISVSDAEDNVAWLWGDMHDVEWECNHPTEDVEFGDDDEQGVCHLCGATCDWGWVKDVVNEGYDADNEYCATVGETRVISEWHNPRYVSGVLGEYMKELRGEKNGKSV